MERAGDKKNRSLKMQDRFVIENPVLRMFMLLQVSEGSGDKGADAKMMDYQSRTLVQRFKVSCPRRYAFFERWVMEHPVYAKHVWGRDLKLILDDMKEGRVQGKARMGKGS